MSALPFRISAFVQLRMVGVDGASIINDVSSAHISANSHQSMNDRTLSELSNDSLDAH